MTVPPQTMPGEAFTMQVSGQQFTVVCPINGGPGAVLEIPLPVSFQ